MYANVKIKAGLKSKFAGTHNFHLYRCSNCFILLRVSKCSTNKGSNVKSKFVNNKKGKNQQYNNTTSNTCEINLEGVILDSVRRQHCIMSVFTPHQAMCMKLSLYSGV